MKCLFAFILIASSFSAFSQVKLPRKTSTVILHSEDSAHIVIVNFAKHLQREGFIIDKLDKELLSLNTDFKSFKWQTGGNVKLYVYAEVEGAGSKLVIRGKAANTGAGLDYVFDVCQCGVYGDLRQAALQQMISVTASFDGGMVSFE